MTKYDFLGITEVILINVWTPDYKICKSNHDKMSAICGVVLLI